MKCVANAATLSMSYTFIHNLCWKKFNVHLHDINFHIDDNIFHTVTRVRVVSTHEESKKSCYGNSTLWCVHIEHKLEK